MSRTARRVLMSKWTAGTGSTVPAVHCLNSRPYNFSEEKFGRVCERRKLRVNVGKSKVMRCSRYGNTGRMHMILNGEPLEAVDCLKYLGSQVAADRGCERDMILNE